MTYRKLGKILLVFSTSITTQQKFIKELCNSNMNFEELDTYTIFKIAVRNITIEYFQDELTESHKIIKKTFSDYLELLAYLQKLHDDKVANLKKIFFRKAKAMNKIILYKYYELLYFAVNKIISSGKNCIFAENIFNDPYPLRKEIFFAFFKIVRENFKVVNIYTNIKSTIEQNTIHNNKIIEKYIKKKIDVKNISSFYDVLKHPLFALEQFPLFFNVTADVKHKENALESISGYELKEAYLESIHQTKRVFGFIVYYQYPYFYHKQSILNEIGKNFIYIKNFKETDLIHISNNKIDYDYNIIDSNHDKKHHICSNTFLDNLSCWLNSEHYKPYIEKRIQQISRKKKIHKQNQTSLCKKVVLTKSIKERIQFLVKENSLVLFLKDAMYNIKNNNDSMLQLFIKKLEINNPLYLFLYIDNQIWVAYLINILPDKILKIMHFNNSNIELKKRDEHLIMINNLYEQISIKLDFHFFTKCIDLNSKTTAENVEFRNTLDSCLNILNNR